MIDFTYNDGGRKASGRKGNAGDCVVRATAILTGKPYAEIYSMMAEYNSVFSRKNAGKLSARNGVAKKAWKSAFKELGIVKQPAQCGAKLTYTEAYAKFGNCIVTTRKHICALVDGSVQDTFDDRAYTWVDEWDNVESRERKALSIWTREE